jgi:plastocyanin
MSKSVILMVALFLIFLGLVGVYGYYARFGNRGISGLQNTKKEVKSFEDLPDYEAGNPKVNNVPENLVVEARSEAKLFDVAVGSSISPALLTITRGDIVTFTNSDTVSHKIIGSGGKWGSWDIEPSKEFSQEFDVPGEYKYYISDNPDITGAIVVM